MSQKKSTDFLKQENMRQEENGYMTVFLTLIMTVLLSLCLTLIEGTRSNAARMESLLVSNIAVDSVMAEYHRELAKQFNIFAIDDSYGTSKACLENTESHLAGYLNKNLNGSDFLFSSLLYRDFLSLGAKKSELEGVLYLSDEGGKVFRRRAYEAIKDDCGIALLSELAESVKFIEDNGLEEMNVYEEMTALQKEISGGDSEKNELIKESRSLGIDIYTPKEDLSFSSPLFFYQYVDDISKLSEETIDSSMLYSSRKKSGLTNSGNLHLEETNSIEHSIERFVFDEYLLRYLGRYMKEGDDDALKYQVEYLIGGKGSDLDNLTIVVSRILAIRFAADFMYILGDKDKCDLAYAMGVAISVFTYTEGMEDVYKKLILMMWAGMEAQYDLRCILAGSRIELAKTSETWHTTLINSLSGKERETKGDDTGLSYDDYLRIFMLMMNEDLLTARAMDMVEADIRLTEGNESFRIDACLDTLAVNIETYSKFGYEYDFHIRRKYE